MQLPQRYKTLLFPGLAAALTAALFWRVLFGDQALFWADLTLQFYPWRKFAAESLLGGELPLWNPYVLAGSPFAANLQSAVFYPLNWLWLGLPVDRGLAWHVALHVFLAGGFTYAFLRHLRLSRMAATVGGLSFMFSGFMLTRLTFLSMASVAVWLPLSLLLADRLVRRPRLREVAALAVCIALSLLGGHLQLSVMLLLTVGAWVAARCLQRVPTGGRRPVLGLWSAVGSVVLGVALAAIQLLPAADFVRHSARASTSFEFASIYSLPPWQLLTLLIPRAFGHPALENYWGEGNYWELCPYFGALGLALAVTAILSRRRRLVAFFGALFGVTLLLCLGKYTPLYESVVYRWLPGFSSFKGPARFLFLTTFAGSVLAAAGADRLLASDSGVRRAGNGPISPATPLVLLTTLCALLLGALVAAPETVQGWSAPWVGSALNRIGATWQPEELMALTEAAFATAMESLLVTLVVLGLGLTVTRLAQHGRLPRAVAGSALVVFIAADLLWSGRDANPTTWREHYRHRPAVADCLRTGAAAPRVLQRPSVFEVAWGRYVSFMGFAPRRRFEELVSGKEQGVTGLVDTLAPNLNLSFGIPSLEGYDPLELRSVNRYLLEAQDRLSASGDTTMLAAVNVGFVETYRPERHVDELNLTRAETPLVYSVRHSLPRCYAIPGSAKAPAKGPRPVGALAAEAVAKAVTTPRITQYGNAEVTVECDLSEPGRLVLADAYEPGWRAFIGGRESEVEPFLGVVRAVPLPGGRHQTTFVYLPTSLRLGGYVTLAALCLVAAMVTASRRRAQRVS